MGLLGVPKLQIEYTLAQRGRGNVYSKRSPDTGNMDAMFPHSSLGTWEHARELEWERQTKRWNSIGNVGTWELAWGTSLGTCLNI